MDIQFVKLHPDAVIPSRAHYDDAGNDLVSIEDVTLRPGERALVKTGIAVSILHGFYGRIAPRSGLALKKGLDVLAGVVDPTYTGEVGVVLINLSQDPVWIHKGDRIAQLIIESCAPVNWVQVDDLAVTSRANGGYGSSGT